MKLMKAAATSSARSFDLLHSSQIVNFNFGGASGVNGRALKKRSLLEEILKSSKSSKCMSDGNSACL